MKKLFSHLCRARLPAFTLGEVLISGFILLTGVVSTMALISRSIQLSNVSQDVIIATNLAQEGIELVRNIRDNNFALGNTPFQGFSTGISYCYIDPFTSPPVCSNGANALVPDQAVLRYSATTGYRVMGSPAAPREKFARYVWVNNPGGTPGSEVVTLRSIVYWDERLDDVPTGAGNNPTMCLQSEQCVFVEAQLTNWK